MAVTVTAPIDRYWQARAKDDLRFMAQNRLAPPWGWHKTNPWAWQLIGLCQDAGCSWGTWEHVWLLFWWGGESYPHPEDIPALLRSQLPAHIAEWVLRQSGAC